MLARLQRYLNSFEYKSNLRWSSDDKPLLLNVDGNPFTKKALQKAIYDAKARGPLKEKVAHPTKRVCATLSAS